MAVSDAYKRRLLIDQKKTEHNPQPSHTPITRSGQPLYSVKVSGIFIIMKTPKSRFKISEDPKIILNLAEVPFSIR